MLFRSLEYLARCAGLIRAVESQEPGIQRAADWFAESILAGRMVHLFGSGHSRILVEEMWPRYGSFPGFNPIVELSLSFHNLVVGANGQRQAMFLENVSGLAERILRNFDLSDRDSALVVSSSVRASSCFFRIFWRSRECTKRTSDSFCGAFRPSRAASLTMAPLIASTSV